MIHRPRGLLASAVGSLLFPNTEREPGPLCNSALPKARDLGVRRGSGWEAGSSPPEAGRLGVVRARQPSGSGAPEQGAGPQSQSCLWSVLWVSVCPRKLVWSAFHRGPRRKPRSRSDSWVENWPWGRLKF